MPFQNMVRLQLLHVLDILMENYNSHAGCKRRLVARKRWRSLRECSLLAHPLQLDLRRALFLLGGQVESRSLASLASGWRFQSSAQTQCMERETPLLTGKVCFEEGRKRLAAHQ